MRLEDTPANLGSAVSLTEQEQAIRQEADPSRLYDLAVALAEEIRANRVECDKAVHLLNEIRFRIGRGDSPAHLEFLMKLLSIPEASTVDESRLILGTRSAELAASSFESSAILRTLEKHYRDDEHREALHLRPAVNPLADATRTARMGR